MRHRLFSLGLLVSAFAGLLFGAAIPSHADTYSIQALTSDNKSFYGMDDSGNVVFSSSALCSQTCYFTFLNGANTGTTFTAPTFTWDYASAPCSHAPCSAAKNGRTASVSLESNGITEDLNILAGLGPSQLLLQTTGITGSLVLDGSGDIVFDNGLADEWYEAIDLSAATPEPASVLLLATGALACWLLVFRRQLATIN